MSRPGRFTPVPVVLEVGLAPQPVWTGRENLPSPSGIRFPDCPTRASRYTDYDVGNPDATAMEHSARTVVEWNLILKTSIVFYVNVAI